jgi:hypothetical protein
MCRMKPNGSTRGNKDDGELLAGCSVEYFEIGSIRLFDRKNRAGRFQDDILGGGTEHQFADF